MRPPAFQFYPADFLADANTIAMSTTEIGAYWLLICVCWREGGLPSDRTKLSTISRLPVFRFDQYWERSLRQCFIQKEDGTWTHNRLEKELLKQEEWREKSSQGGKASAAKRAKGGSTTVPRVVQPKVNSSSSTLKDHLSDPLNLENNPPANAGKNVFEQFKKLVEFKGGTRELAGSFLGKCLSEYPREEVEKVAALTVINDAEDPRAYMRAILNGTAKGHMTQAEMNTARNRKLVL